MTTASDLRAINGDVYNPSTNAGGLDGPGGMEANFPKALGLIAQGLDDMAVYLSQANFLAAQASVATILQLCQALVAQITKGSTEALAFPAVDKLLLSTPNVAQVFVYDTRRDDRLPDGSRWNEPGRCSAMSYWHEAQGTYTGVKRDVPAVLAISALREQWYLHDALDLDPVTGVPRLWRASNPTGNGLVLCGSSAPITCVFARNGYLYFGTGMGLHVVSLTGDWCERYDNSGRRRRLGTFAQRNTVLHEGGVIASGALPATAINSVHARVYPGAPLDAAGLPIPTVAVACGSAGTVAVIHPTGAVAVATGLSNCASVYLTERATLLCEQLGFDAVEIALPYATGTPTVVQRFGAYRTTYGGLPINFSANAAYIMGDGAIGGRNGGGVTFLAKDYGNDAAGMVAYVTPGYATGWQPGDIRLATLCDAATGAITSSGELVSNPGGPFTTAAGFTTNGAAVSVSAGELVVTAATSGGYGTISIATVAGSTYLVVVPAKVGTTTAARARAVGLTVRAEGYTTAPTVAPIVFQFTADSATTEIRLACDTVGTAAFDGLSVKLAAADRSYKGKGLVVNGTLQRNPVATGADVVAWSGFLASNYLQRSHDADMPFGAGDFYVGFWCKGATTGTTILSTAAPDGAGAALRVLSTTNGPDVAFINSLGGWGGEVFGGTRLDGSDFVKVDILRRNGVVEVWTNGVLGGSGTNTTDLTNAAGALTVGKEPVGGFSTDGALAQLRIGAYAPTPAQIRRQYADEAPLFQPDAKALVGGSSSAVSSLDRDPLTGRLAVGTGDGVSVFSRLRRVSYYDEPVLAATSSDTVRSVALRGGLLLIGTAAEVGFFADALGGKEAITVGGPRPVGSGFIARGLTTDGAALDLAPRVPVGERETVMVEARIIGRVTGAADTERLTYTRRATYYRDAGGAITLQGSVQSDGSDTEVTGTADATLAIVGDWVATRVTGVTGKRIRWEATFIITRLSEETSYAA